MIQDDSLWKGLLEEVFDDFLCFVYPNEYQNFDFEKGFEFLDKELDNLFPHLEGNAPKFVDKLVKVNMKNGEDRWFLVHVEVQSYWDKVLGDRMFTYYYRIRDRYNKEVTAWVILADDNKTYRPNQYQTQFLGTELIYNFNVYKILDQDEEQLKQSDNIFASVVLTVLLHLRNKKKLNESNVVELKLEIARNLVKKEFTKKKIRAVMNFLRFFMRLSPKLNELFEKELHVLTGKKDNMGIEQMILERERAEGRAEGIDLGVQKNKIETVIAARQDGMKIPRIARIAKISEEEVIQILKEHDLD